MRDEELRGTERTLEGADPSSSPGAKQRVWNRITAPEPSPRPDWRPRTLTFVAAAVALVLLAPQLGRLGRKGSKAEALSPDWRSGVLYAAELPTVGSQTPLGEAPASGLSQEERLDRVDRLYMDYDALYWAWRVAFVKDVAYAELVENSKAWVGRDSTKQEMLRRLKALLDSGAARPLTEEESRRQVEGVNKARAILGTGPLGTPLEGWPILEKTDVVDRRIMDLDARYWAWRISSERDVSYEGLLGKSDNWIMRRKTRDELFGKIKSLLDRGPVAALSADEMKLLDEGRAEIRKILSD